MLYARLRDVKRELNQWVGELPYVQYSKNNAYHSGIRTTPYRVHFVRAPADLSVDMTLPKEVVERLETEDDLCGVLESRQVIGYASFDPSSDTPLASPNPLPFSHLSLQEPASVTELGGPVSSFTYDEVPESEYTSSIGMSSQQPPLEEPSILSPLLPSSSLPAETDDNSYDIRVPPLIGSEFTPYFDLATGTAHQVAPALPSVQLHTEASDFSPEDRSDDIQYEEELHCTSCPEKCLPANCMARVQAFGAMDVQCFCELDENYRRALTAARTRRSAWITLNKQGQDMIKSSNKRIKLLDVGDNVRIPIPSVDRAPLGPTSLVGAVLGVSSTGNTLQLGTKHGRIANPLSHSKALPVVAINSSLPP